MDGDAKDRFPRHLLNEPGATRLKYFRELKVKHPLLSSAYNELWSAVRDSNPGSIIFLLGPPGAGKSTLLEKTRARLTEAMLEELRVNMERLPVVMVQLNSPTHGSFDWIEYFKELLAEMEEPLIDYKEDIEALQDIRQRSHTRFQSNMRLLNSERPGVRALRLASFQTLKHRKPLAVLLDDAQHLGIVSSGRKLSDQLNAIKTQASKSLVTHVLCGTYELAPLRNLNGQLSRRSFDIHFKRYHANDVAQRDEFINVLYTFQQHIPLPKTSDLISRWDYFYERSIGCIGVLKDWLTRALSLAIGDNSETLSMEYIERRALSVTQCTNMLRETLVGEKEFEESEESRSFLRQNLKLPTMPIVLTEQDPQASIKPMINSKPRRKGRVGKRNPKRDKIGVGAA
ncbi:MAG: AAA family ATPase [Acidobacteria bacterium]|nr:AAA family ATPase [Acidobacteriota bacterium]